MGRQVWDSHTLQCLRTLEGHEDNVRVLAVGERFLYSGSWDKSIRCAPPPTCHPCKCYYYFLACWVPATCCKIIICEQMVWHASVFLGFCEDFCFPCLRQITEPSAECGWMQHVHD